MAAAPKLFDLLFRGKSRPPPKMKKQEPCPPEDKKSKRKRLNMTLNQMSRDELKEIDAKNAAEKEAEAVDISELDWDETETTDLISLALDRLEASSKRHRDTLAQAAVQTLRSTDATNSAAKGIRSMTPKDFPVPRDSEPAAE